MAEEQEMLYLPKLSVIMEWKRKGMVIMSCVKLLKRYLLLCAGLAVMAFGVAFSIKASLGTSPISSFPYVVSVITPLTVGNATILMHCFFILLQIAILRKEYQLIQLLQLPVAAAVFVGPTSKQIIRQWDKWKKETAISEK